MLRSRRFLLIAAAVAALLVGYFWWSSLPRFPVTRPAAELVLQQADLPDPFRPVPAESMAITDNPYADFTSHFRSGYRTEFRGAADSRWGNTRILNASFVTDRKGAERIYAMYVENTVRRGQFQPAPDLGDERRFVIARNEEAAPTVIIGVVRVQNALITLTVMTDQVMDLNLVYAWAQTLADRASPGPLPCGDETRHVPCGGEPRYVLKGSAAACAREFLCS